MYSHSTSIRVHYALTDQMGVVYHGHYAQFYEIGRTESIRELGFTYKSIEAMGVIMPVVDMHVRYFHPTRYDDLITVQTSLRELPEQHRVVFHGEIRNEEGILLSTGEITMYFLEAGTRNKTAMPAPLRERLKPFFG